MRKVVKQSNKTLDPRSEDVLLLPCVKDMNLYNASAVCTDSKVHSIQIAKEERKLKKDFNIHTNHAPEHSRTHKKRSSKVYVSTGD